MSRRNWGDLQQYKHILHYFTHPISVMPMLQNAASQPPGANAGRTLFLTFCILQKLLALALVWTILVFTTMCCLYNFHIIKLFPFSLINSADNSIQKHVKMYKYKCSRASEKVSPYRRVPIVIRGTAKSVKSAKQVLPPIDGEDRYNNAIRNV